MRRIRPSRWPRPQGGDVLWMLLLAIPLAPLPARLWGAALALPYGFTRWELGAIAAALALAYVGRQARRAGAPGARVAALLVAATVAVAAACARIMEERSSGFYTERALYEGVAGLIGLHLVATLLRMAGAWHMRRRAQRHPEREPVTATGFADYVTSGTAWLIVGFWLLSAFNARDVAFVLMMAAGVSAVLTVVLRLPDAVRALQRWSVPAALLAVALLAGCTPRPGSRALPVAFFTPPAGDCAPDTARRDTLRADAELSLRLNIPAYRLDVLADSAVAWSYGVAIGMRKYATPTGRFAVHRIVWNPWWIPPKSEWARREKVTPPGPDNPMGRVKLVLESPYYLHGTPFAVSVGSAASHGCVRMRNEDAMALARLIQGREGAGPGDSAIAALASDTVRSDTVVLARPIPTSIVYEVAEVRGDSLLLHPDVYRRLHGRTRDAALQALVAAGRDTTRLRRTKLATAVRRAGGRHVAVPLDSLFLRPVPDTALVARTP